MVEQLLFSVPETAVVLGVSKRTVWQLIHDRQISSVKVGKKFTKVSKKTIEQFIDKGTVPEKKQRSK